MSTMEDYIEKVRKETQGFSEDEMIRYIYMDLGKRLTFNLKFFCGNSRAKIKVYTESKRKNIGEALRTNIIICKDSSYILEHILRELGVNIVTIVDPEDFRKCKHVYNLVKPADGRPPYVLDLQVDMENIQSHMRTTEFGKSENRWRPAVISRDEIEQMDWKIGYVTKQDYYTNEYIDNLRLGAELFDDFGEKIKFLLENIDVYDTKNMGYAEKVKHHSTVLGKILKYDEISKIDQIDCYREDENGRKYISCLTVDVPKKGTDIYLFSDEDNQYKEISVEELARQTETGELVIIGMIPPVLKQFLKRQKSREER